MVGRFRRREKPAPGATIDWSHPRARGLVTAMLCNSVDRNRVRDSVHPSQNFALTGTGALRSGRLTPPGRALDLSVATVQATTPAFLQLQPPFTVITDFVPDALSTTAGLVGVSSSGQFAYAAYGAGSGSAHRAVGRILYGTGSGTSLTIAQSIADALPFGQRMCVAFTVQDGVLLLYCNGQLVASGSYDSSQPLFYGSGSFRVGTGGSAFAASQERAFVYSRALAAGELAADVADPFAVWLPSIMDMLPPHLPVVVTAASDIAVQTILTAAAARVRAASADVTVQAILTAEGRRVRTATGDIPVQVALTADVVRIRAAGAAVEVVTNLQGTAAALLEGSADAVVVIGVSGRGVYAVPLVIASKSGRGTGVHRGGQGMGVGRSGTGHGVSHGGGGRA